MAGNDLHEITLYVHAETPRAWRVSEDGDNERNGQWIPKSQIEHVVETEQQDISVFTLPEWLAIEKGFF